MAFKASTSATSSKVAALENGRRAASLLQPSRPGMQATCWPWTHHPFWLMGFSQKNHPAMGCFPMTMESPDFSVNISRRNGFRCHFQSRSVPGANKLSQTLTCLTGLENCNLLRLFDVLMIWGENWAPNFWYHTIYVLPLGTKPLVPRAFIFSYPNDVDCHATIPRSSQNWLM